MRGSVLVVVLLVSGCNKPDPQPGGGNGVAGIPAAEAADADPARVVADYAENTVAADGKYRGKTYRVRVNVGAIDRGSDGAAVVRSVLPDNRSGAPDLEFRFTPETESTVADLKRGDTATITGTVVGKDGETFPLPPRGFRVVFSNCSAARLTAEAPGGKQLGLADFRSLIEGKTAADVVRVAGEPASKSKNKFGVEAWRYEGITRDPATGKPDRATVVEFTVEGRVLQVSTE